MALIDNVEILVKAGNGGNADVSFGGFRKGVKIHPHGGDGGRGGSIYIVASHNISDLSEFRYKKEIKAEHGEKGMPQNHNGRNAEDLEISVPLGTQIIEANGVVTNLEKDGDRVLIAKGGDGGIGSFKNKVLRLEGNVRVGGRGEEKRLKLVLTLIADVGLVGLPNAGKSSLLAALTAARPKIGNYPFTTLEPNIGVMDGLVIADIPGLIEGASLGAGLGIKFLKHIEKTKIILHCIEATSDDPMKSYETIQEEFEKFNPDLLEKKEIILITKKDLVSSARLEKIAHELIETDREVMFVSIEDEESLEELKNKLHQLLV